mgnify:CR=1 FL=1
MTEYDHYDDEAGLPAPLPADETVLWQGAPLWREFAVTGFHVRKLLIYFTVLLLLRIWMVADASAALVDVALAASWFVLLGATAIGILLLMAWLIERTTVYTITNKRLLMRIGVTLPMTINVPFSKIIRVDLRLHGDDQGGASSADLSTGDITIALAASEKLSYVVMWPHVKPWSFSRTEAMLRVVPAARQVAEMLANAIAEAKQDKRQPGTTHSTLAPTADQPQSDWQTNQLSGVSS